MIESSEPARRVAEALRDLEASFLITSQKQQWLDGEREDWLETVRLVARVVDRPLMTFGLLRVIGSLLNDLAMSLKEGSFVPAFTRPRTAVDATRKSLWHARVEAILISGIANDEGETIVHFGGSPDQENYLEIYEGWNATFRIYSPQAEYFDGSWEVPSPQLVGN